MVLCTFRLGDLYLGVDIRLIQEIKRAVNWTPVPGAAPHVRGLLNNRGRVTTLIDLKRRLNWIPEASTSIKGNKKEYEVILKTRHQVSQIDESLAREKVFWDDSAALMVDQLGEVVEVIGQQMQSPPANLGEISSDLVEAVVEQEKALLIILNVARIIGAKDEES
ncbi:chemotaxis protein CheW [Magnetofaba australis]|uniref:Putative CheW protein n=1 Tax=Magnetofaba australis IT-1 TaxID=1434232 RepID=A0A1Y2K987_9PROT|nr:chemotaxis protein CheW [Magnetofaba australis]OSM07242.1 putative CheW protein [Magnetofaba australis IT-1]